MNKSILNRLQVLEVKLNKCDMLFVEVVGLGLYTISPDDNRTYTLEELHELADIVFIDTLPDE